MNQAIQPKRLMAALALLCGCWFVFGLEPEEIWERVSPSVVRVVAEMIDGEKMQGSGFVSEIDGKKFVLSNRHVVLGAKSVRVGHSETNLLPALGYRISPDLDLAIIELPTALALPSLKKRWSDAKTGERVYAVGFPLGLNKSISQGIVGSLSEKLVQFDAPISSGSSGGPLVDKNGQVIAVVSFGSVSGTDQVVQNLNFAIKIDAVPKVEVFRDPILSFYDAWLELVKFENGLIDRIKDLRAIELLTYLKTEYAYALAAPNQKETLISDDQKVNREEQESLLRLVTERHGSLERAGTAVGAFLKAQVKAFDRVPSMFLGVPNQPLFQEFARDKRPGGLFRLNIHESEIVPLLRVSLEHPKAKYEDATFQVDFMIRNLEALRSPSNALTKRLGALVADANSAKSDGWERKSARLDYAQADLTNSEASARMFIRSLFPYSPSQEVYSECSTRHSRAMSTFSITAALKPRSHQCSGEWASIGFKMEMWTRRSRS